MIKTKDIKSSEVFSVRSGETMKAARVLMLEKKIRHLPVLNEKEFVIGILSDRDVLLAMNSVQINAFQKYITLDENLVVDDYMSWPVYTVSDDTSIRRVAEEMLSQKMSAFLVEDSQGHLAGIVSADDLLRILVAYAPILPETKIQHFIQKIFEPGNVYQKETI